MPGSWVGWAHPNHPAWRVERARVRALATGVVLIDAFQLNHTYLALRPGTRHPDVQHRFGPFSDEQRDYATEHGFEVWAYSPLMSGRYDNPAKPMPEVYQHNGNERLLATLAEVAAQTGATRGQVVLAWLVAKGVRPILGGS